MDEPAADGSQTSTPEKSKQRHTRNRIACDWCHSNHARCDRDIPCGRCLDKGTRCEFTRLRRKRGRIPKVESRETRRKEAKTNSLDPEAPSPDAHSTSSTTIPSVQTPNDSQSGLHSAHGLTVLSPDLGYFPLFQGAGFLTQGLERKEHITGILPLTQDVPSLLHNAPLKSGFNDNSFPAELINNARSVEPSTPSLPRREGETVNTTDDIMSTLRYPVLQPLMPLIRTKISPELACALLNLYFTSAFPTQTHPICKHIHCYVLRKASFLNEKFYRSSSPALLASMLWVASLNDQALSLTITDQYRKKINDFLGALTIKLLEVSPTRAPFDKHYLPATNWALCSMCGFGSPPNLGPTSTANNNNDCLGFSPASFDDIVTYMHIASISSTSGQEAQSMNWWHAAFTLAREHKLNTEKETLPSDDSQEFCFPFMDPSSASSASTRRVLDCVCCRNYGSTIRITEEQREERRRVWWLLYIMDRHLALRYNRPLMLLDFESKDLLLPLDEETWQAGEIHSNSPGFDGPQCTISELKNIRRRFPDFTCHDTSIFGFYLPLMTILGQMIDLNYMQNHPMLAEVPGDEAWQIQLHGVLGQLDAYEASLNTFITSVANLGSSPLPASNHDTSERSQAQTHSWLAQTMASYASFYVDLLHIIQNGKWDPVSLVGDRGFWTSSPDLSLAVPHALKAADSVRQVLKFDPDVSFMPEFFSVQLLQGSFYFLLILQQLQDKAGEIFLSACAVMIRANESCIVTLGSEYQRSFCQIMRSTLAQARGRPVNDCQILQRTKAIMALRRWS
ncbi:transcription factor domain-containing protein [Aspergillus undulatus]|uniref:transcription factor domain-containing protein n=1 Tax=Aspergillus undulatus TaxID=1810928 RepID=UPI003CCCA579